MICVPNPQSVFIFCAWSSMQTCKPSSLFNDLCAWSSTWRKQSVFIFCVPDPLCKPSSLFNDLCAWSSTWTKQLSTLPSPMLYRPRQALCSPYVGRVLRWEASWAHTSPDPLWASTAHGERIKEVLVTLVWPWLYAVLVELTDIICAPY